MNYTYYKDNILMCGKMLSGKTYQTKRLISTAPRDRILVLDAHPQDSGYDKIADRSNIMVSSRPYNSLWIDKFIATARKKEHFHSVVVFDDIDLYIKYANDSESLKDFFIDARHNYLAAIVQSKRPVNLDKRIIQNCRYVFIFKGISTKDFIRIKDETQIDDDERINELYDYLKDSPDDEHLFILIDTQTKECNLRNNLKFR